MNALKIAFCLLVSLLFTGCASPSHKSAAPSPRTDYGQAAYTPAEYRIQPGDLLDVKFFYNPELNEQVAVRTDGKITLQLVNEVAAAGLTPSELTDSLTQAYSTELVTPKIVVIVRVPVAEKIYVDGEVNKAGVLTLSGPTTAVQSIAQAGGMKDTARPEEIIVIRREAGGAITTFQVDVAGVRSGAKDDMVLRPNDIVYVPKSSIANVNTWVDQYIRNNIPLPVGLGYSIR